MPVRTNAGLVQGVLQGGGDWMPGKDLAPYIESASATVDDLVAYASGNNIPVPDPGRQELVERWLAAHDYKLSDRQLKSKSNSLGASGSFEGSTAMGFDATLYGQRAKTLDTTGFLRLLDKAESGSIVTGANQAIQGAWLGKRWSAKNDWSERNV